MRHNILLFLVFGILTASFSLSDTRAEDVVVHNVTELRQALNGARAGHVIRIAPGRYPGGQSAAGLQGTADAPIRITALDLADPPVFEGGGNAFHFSSVSHIVVESLVLSGSQYNGINIDDGGKSDRPSHHVVLKGLTVRDIGSGGNHDGIKLSGLKDFKVENCRLSNWGKGGSAIDMVGCHQGEILNCTFFGSEDDAGNGVQAKGGSSEIRILGCRFDNVGSRGVNLGGSTGLPFFRPIDAPFEARNIAVEDCVFLGSPAPIAFVGVDGAKVRHNTIYLPGKYVVRILQENTNERFVKCRNGVIERNLIIFDPARMGSTTNVGPNTMPETFGYVDNAWFSTDQRGRKPRHEIREEKGVTDRIPIFVDRDGGDLRQSRDSPTREYGSRADTALTPSR
ncbi:hypothetical protein GC170_03785 [bacterium]|nr:hypothetical protein [bacterium]